MNKGNVIIIGGSGGIGSEIVRVLIEASIRVINIDRVPLKLDSKYYTEILVDLESKKADGIFKELLNQHGSVDCFISALGYYGVDTLDDFTYEKYTHTLKVNLEIPTLFSISVCNIMKTQGYGKMIFISSAAAYIGSRDIAYSVSKAGILGLVRGLTKNLKGVDVYTYGVAPGIVETDMSNQMSIERQNDAICRTLNNRKCTPAEIAKIIRFLLQEDDGYMNGTVIHVNNGLYFN